MLQLSGKAACWPPPGMDSAVKDMRGAVWQSRGGRLVVAEADSRTHSRPFWTFENTLEPVTPCGRVLCAQNATPKDSASFGVVSGRYGTRTCDP